MKAAKAALFLSNRSFPPTPEYQQPLIAQPTLRERSAYIRRVQLHCGLPSPCALGSQSLLGCGQSSRAGIFGVRCFPPTWQRRQANPISEEAGFGTCSVPPRCLPAATTIGHDFRPAVTVYVLVARHLPAVAQANRGRCGVLLLLRAAPE